MMNDRALVEGSLHGDVAAFAELVRKYRAPLLASAYHLLGHAEDAQDVAQETFIEAFRRLASLREAEKLHGWLFTILRHKCLLFLQARRVDDVSLAQVEDSLPAPADIPDEQNVWSALQRLPLAEREILAARYFQELSFAEIAIALDISVHNAEVRCSRARAHLRNAIREMEEEETRTLMQRAMGALPAGLMSEIFIHQVIQRVAPMMPPPAPAATSSLNTATALAAKKTLAAHLLAQAAGWKVAATVACVVTVIGAVQFLAPRLAKPHKATTGAMIMTAQAASLAPEYQTPAVPSLAMTAAIAAPPAAPPMTQADPAVLPLMPANGPTRQPLPRPEPPARTSLLRADARAGTPIADAHPVLNHSSATDNKSLTRISGKVVGVDGQPIAGASLMLYPLHGQHEEKPALDLPGDVEGNFSAEVDLSGRLPFPDIGNVIAYAPGYALTGALLRESANVITLNPGTTINGTVVDAGGKPLAGIPVRLCYLLNNNMVHTDYERRAVVPDEWRARFTAISDADGGWKLPGILSEGKASFALADDRYVYEQQEITLVAGEKVATVRFMARPGAILTGRVLTPDGQPARDARVSVNIDSPVSSPGTSAYGKTAADGSYRFAGLPAGTYTISANNRDQASIAAPLKDITLAAGKTITAPDLHAYVGALLEGTVVDAETSVPLPYAFITLYHGKQLGSTFSADKTGHFLLRTQPGQVAILASQYGYLRQPEMLPAELQQGDSVTVTMKLHKGLCVSGTVTDEDGQPAADVVLSLSIPSGALSNFVTDERGHFEAGGLTAGTRTLECQQTGEWELPAPLAVEVPSQEPIHVRVTRSAMHMVTGRVVDSRQQPLAGVAATFSVTVVRHSTLQKIWELTTFTGKDGGYQLANIPAGGIVSLLTLVKAGYRRPDTGTLTNGGKDTIDDAVLVACTSVVHGKVCDADGKPVPGATVVSVEGGLDARAITDATGAFALAAQPAGELHLIAATATSGGLATCKDEPARITCLPDTIASPMDIPLALKLLDADSKLPQEQRQFNRDETLHELADVDIKQANTLALAGVEPISDGLRAYLLGKMAEINPENVELAQLNLLHDPACKLYAAVEVGLAAVQTDRGMAEQLYQIARPIYAGEKHDHGSKYISGLGNFTDISLRTIALAELLHKTVDVDAMLAQLLPLTNHTGNSITGPLLEAAGRVSPEFVFTVYDRIDDQNKCAELSQAVMSMAAHDPAAALRLLNMIAAKRLFNMISTNMGNDFFPCIDALPVIKALGKKDPAAALALAKTPPFMNAMTLLEAAAFQPKATAGPILQHVFAEDRERTMLNIAIANTIDADLAKELYTQYKTNLEAESYTLPIPSGSSTLYRVKYAYQLSGIDSVEARLILETEFAVAIRQAERTRQIDYLLALQHAMCALDLSRAQKMLHDIVITVQGGQNGFLQNNQQLMQFILMTREERIADMVSSRRVAWIMVSPEAFPLLM